MECIPLQDFLLHMDLSKKWYWISHQWQPYLLRLDSAKASFFWGTLYLYPKNDTNEYPNIFVSKRWYERISEYIRIKKAIRMNIRIYSYQKNDTNMMQTNIHIGKYSNVRIHSYQIFDISFRFDARGWIFDVWYNRKLKHSWHNKIEVIFLWTLIFVWTIWAIYLLDLLAQTLDFSLEYIRIKKRYERISEYIRIKKIIRTNIRIYSYQQNLYEWISEYINNHIVITCNFLRCVPTAQICPNCLECTGLPKARNAQNRPNWPKMPRIAFVGAWTDQMWR